MISLGIDEASKRSRAHVFDNLDERKLARIDQASDGDSHLLRVRESWFDFDFANLLRLFNGPSPSASGRSYSLWTMHSTYAVKRRVVVARSVRVGLAESHLSELCPRFRIEALCRGNGGQSTHMRCQDIHSGDNAHLEDQERMFLNSSEEFLEHVLDELAQIDIGTLTRTGDIRVVEDPFEEL